MKHRLYRADERVPIGKALGKTLHQLGNAFANKTEDRAAHDLGNGRRCTFIRVDTRILVNVRIGCDEQFSAELCLHPHPDFWQSLRPREGDGVAV